ncbi:uncharacterized protein LOC125505115 [Dendroctonus ponderosae]|uniref:uncharacterized protein LOC125505115 n=1 Tax=Dendroctonus ponderosae TaxID=77166 RepID=UPI0020353B6E|nr:uncharacterized protein LOC125505115 [Dendroctonus ponderosae]KAH1012821.1 hypothetical protein HUJ05_011907 [Dendroctonus ponderosae]
MAHGLNSVIKRDVGAVQCKPEGKTGVGSRRIFSPQFKLQVLDSYRNDGDCKGNQRATARKYGIHRRQIQKWLQVEGALRSGVSGKHQLSTQTVKSEVALNGHRQRDDESSALRSASLASEARVPAMEPPAGFRAHHMAPICSPDPAKPMDLSFKRTATSPHASPSVAAYFPVLGPSTSLPTLRQPDVWDLSKKSNKRKADTVSATAKPAKLFKPYLDDDREVSSSSVTFGNSVSSTSLPVTPPLIQNIYSPQSLSLSRSSFELYYNNNNIVQDAIKYECECASHELKGPETTLLGSPYYTDLSPKYHLERYLPSPTYIPYEEPPAYTQLKRRGSCGLDLDLSAIDCSPDSLCKGNPRAVIMKYNSPSRDDFKWTPHYELRHTSELKGEIKVEY